MGGTIALAAGVRIGRWAITLDSLAVLFKRLGKGTLTDFEVGASCAASPWGQLRLLAFLSLLATV